MDWLYFLKVATLNAHTYILVSLMLLEMFYFVIIYDEHKNTKFYDTVVLCTSIMLPILYAILVFINSKYLPQQIINQFPDEKPHILSMEYSAYILFLCGFFNLITDGIKRGQSKRIMVLK